jgi:hypothetical protein
MKRIFTLFHTNVWLNFIKAILKILKILKILIQTNWNLSA